MATISEDTKEEARRAAWNACYGKSGQDATDASAEAVMMVVLKRMNKLEEEIRDHDVRLPVTFKI